MLKSFNMTEVKIQKGAPIGLGALIVPEGVNYTVFHSHDDLNADILFSIGGDGTILDTVPFVRDSGMPVLGINMGRLGFLSSISKSLSAST